jgi:hypothetical protein
MTQFKSIKTTLLGSLTAGLLWIGPGAAYIAAQNTTAPGDTFETPGTRMDRFTATTVTEPRTVIQFTGNSVTTIPGTSVKFTQHGTTPQAVVVTFVADWPKPRQEEIPLGSFASGVIIRPIIDFGTGAAIGSPIESRLGGVTLFEGGGVATDFSVSNGSHGFTFVTDPVPAGDHVLEIQAFSDALGQPGQPNGTVVLRGRSTVVMHD